MDNRQKFTNKVADYVKYRPSYPQAFIEYLVKDVGINKNSAVADVGAGTGLLTKLLAGKVKNVYAVEPNARMRAACEEYCKGLENFTAVDGSAEDTNLPNKSMDFITVAQAFHWFDREKTKIEFQRILKPQGRVVLVWNSRNPESAVVKENDALCRRVCPGFNGFSGGSDIKPDAYSDFFKKGCCEYRVFKNDRMLSLESYIGSSLSASYAPLPGEGNYQAFIDGLTELFNRYSNNGRLVLPQNTHSYAGEI